MKISQLGNCLSVDVQSLIEPPTVTIIKVELEDKLGSNIIKIKMRRNPDSAASETYKLKYSMF